MHKKPFYGWVVVVASFFILFAMIGVRFSYGIFFKSLQGEFALTRAATSSVFSAYMIFSALFVVPIGWALDRYGPRLVVSLMGLLAGLSLLLTSQVSSFWQLFFTYSLLLSIGTAGSMPVLMSTLSRWFDKKRGLAVGIGGAGADLGVVAMAPLASYLISALRWQMSYVIIGLVTWFVVIPLSVLLRKNPREIELWPDGEESGSNGLKAAEISHNSKLGFLSLIQVLRTRNFWFLWFYWLFFALCYSLVLTHIVPYATDLGITTVEASTIVSIIGIMSILSRSLVGKVTDIVGEKVPGIICALLQAGALIGLIWARDLWMFYLFAVAFGLSFGGLANISITLVADIFGGHNLGVIMGATDVGFAAGAGIGPIIGGLIFDINNDYAMAFVIGAVAMVITASLIVLVGYRRIINTPKNFR